LLVEIIFKMLNMYYNHLMTN